MSSKNPLNLRLPDELRASYVGLAEKFSKKEARRVTTAHILRRALEIAQPVLEQELNETAFPGVTVVTPITRLREAQAFMLKAVEIGFHHMNADNAVLPAQSL